MGARADSDSLRVELDAIYFCPHRPDSGCACRKPATGLFRRAAHEHGLELAGSVFLGDRLRDVVPADALCGVPALVRTGHGGREARRAPPHVAVFGDLRAAALALVTGPERR